MAYKQHLVIADLRGGRNGADPPMSLPENQCAEALNVEWFASTLGEKRAGASSVSMTGAAALPPIGYLASIFVGSSDYRDYPFTVDNQSPARVNVYDPSVGWVGFTTGDAVEANPYSVCAESFNGVIYGCFDSAVDRLHRWSDVGADPLNLGVGWTRVGIPAPTAAPTVANQGSGSYTATVRYYKVVWANYNAINGTLDNRSEASAAVTFTPSGSGLSARVTRPAYDADETMTHWELYGSADGNIYRLLATTALATTYYDDATAPASYTGDFIPLVGANTVPGSWKYIATNGNRLLGVGNFEGGEQARVWFTPVMGASDIGDAERVPTSNYIDLDAYDGEPATGIVGGFMGNTIVFKTRQIWRLIQTGDGVAPYAAVCLTKSLGCIAPKSIVVGEDASGAPALYFLSHRGPYRLGRNGLEYCGRDVEDVIARLNMSATVVSHAVWYPGKHQVWFWVALDSDTFPTERLVFDVHLGQSGRGGIRGGWARHTGESCEMRCSMAYGAAVTSGANASLYPWAGGGTATGPVLLRCDDTAQTSDNNTTFQAYIKTKPYPLGGLGFNCSVGQSHLTASANRDVTITQTIDRDFGAEERTSTCVLTANAGEARVQRQFDGSDTQGAGVVQFQLGDATATNAAWALDALVVPFSKQEER